MDWQRGGKNVCWPHGCIEPLENITENLLHILPIDPINNGGDRLNGLRNKEDETTGMYPIDFL
jgi:hypothetical protein